MRAPWLNNPWLSFVREAEGTTSGTTSTTGTDQATDKTTTSSDTGDDGATTPPETRMADAFADDGDKTDQDKTDQDAGEKTDQDADVDADPVPEKYELQPPEGFESIDQATLEKFDPLLRKYGIGQQGAQEFTNLVGEHVVKPMLESAIGEAQAAEDNRVAAIEQSMREALTRDGYENLTKVDREHPAFQDAVKGLLALTQNDQGEPDKAMAGQIMQALDAARVSAAVFPILAKVGRKAGSDRHMPGGDAPGKRDPAAVMYPNDSR